MVVVVVVVVVVVSIVVVMLWYAGMRIEHTAHTTASNDETEG